MTLKSATGGEMRTRRERPTDSSEEQTGGLREFTLEFWLGDRIVQIDEIAQDLSTDLRRA